MAGAPNGRAETAADGHCGVEEVAAGAEVIIAKAGKPIARLVPLSGKPRAKKLGLLRGRIRVPDDFNATLPPAILDEFEGR